VCVWREVEVWGVEGSMDTNMGCGRAVHVGCDTRWEDGHTCVYVGENKCIEVNLHTRVSNTV